MFLRRRERLCLFSSNKCKLFQDVDDILLGTIHHLSLWRFLFCLEELTWFSRRTKWDQSSPTKGGLWKIDSHKAKGGGGEGGEEEGGIINYRVSGRIGKPSVTSIPPIIPGRPGMGCGQPSQAIQDRQAQTHLLGFFMNDSSACP